MPKFSIIVPVYKAEEYLDECVNSILLQTYKDFELILVNDGSPDNCPAMCDTYAQSDDRIKVIHKKNQGVSMARQDGISISTGEYLVFVDADDFIVDVCLETIALHDGVDIIRYGFKVEKADGEIIDRLPKEREGYFSKHDIEKEVFPYLIQDEAASYYASSLCVHAFKKSLFVENMLKDVVVRIGEDSACVIPCVYNAKSLYCIKKCMYFYRYNVHSATKGKKVFSWNDPITVKTHLLDKIDINRFDLAAQLDRKVVHELFSVVISQFNRDEKYSTIKKDILENISQCLYDESINNAQFNGSLRAKLMLISLRYRLIILIKIYSMIR